MFKAIGYRSRPERSSNNSRTSNHGTFSSRSPDAAYEAESSSQRPSFGDSYRSEALRRSRHENINNENVQVEIVVFLA